MNRRRLFFVFILQIGIPLLVLFLFDLIRNDDRFIVSMMMSRWSSLVTIDPKNVLSTLVKKGGLFLPEPIENELNNVASVLDCSTTQLDLAHKVLLIHNLTIAVPSSSSSIRRRPALRIGRIYVTWDSYIQPCVEVTIEDVDIEVEFTNLLLTHTNWHELNEKGFPPEMEYFYSDGENNGNHRDEPTTTNDENDVRRSWIQIGKADLIGTVILRTRSRILEKQLVPEMVLDLECIKELNEQITAQSERNRFKFGRRGCVTNEIYDIYTTFFTTKLKETMESVTANLILGQLDDSSQHTGNKETVDQVKNIVTNTRELIMDYAQEASRKITSDKVIDTFGGVFSELDIDHDSVKTEVNDLVDDLLTSSRQIFTVNNVRNWGNKIRQHILIRRQSDDNNDHPNNNEGGSLNENRMGEDIIFPDW